MGELNNSYPRRGSAKCRGRCLYSVILKGIFCRVRILSDNNVVILRSVPCYVRVISFHLLQFNTSTFFKDEIPRSLSQKCLSSSESWESAYFPIKNIFSFSDGVFSPLKFLSVFLKDFFLQSLCSLSYAAGFRRFS